MARHRLPRGFTLIELLMVVALVGVLLALIAPSFRDFVLIQRLRGVNAQLVTDLQFARSEAAARGLYARVLFASDATQICYTIYTTTVNAQQCNCLLGANAACPNAATREIRTVSLERSRNVLIIPTQAEGVFGFAFDHITGGIVSMPLDTFGSPINVYNLTTWIDATRQLRTSLNQAGRITVCSPAGSRVTEPAC